MFEPTLELRMPLQCVRNRAQKVKEVSLSHSKLVAEPARHPSFPFHGFTLHVCPNLGTARASLTGNTS